MRERRMQRPYRRSLEQDAAWSFLATIAVTFLVGCMCGAALGLGWAS